VLVATHGGADADLDFASGHLASASSSSSAAPSLARRSSRLSRPAVERRGRARMSLAGYNEAAYYGAVSILADAEDCSSTRDSSNLTRTLSEEGSPWAVWRQWAADSESGLSDSGDDNDPDQDKGSGSATSDGSEICELGQTRRRSTRRADRASLTAYNCTGAVSVTGEEGEQHVPGADGVGAETGGRLSTIGEVLEMGYDWLSDGASPRPPNHESDGQEAAQVSTADAPHPDGWHDAGDSTTRADDPEATTMGSLFWANDTEDDSLDMGLQDDPIAEAGFIFAVEYGQACAHGNSFSRGNREAAAVG